MSPAPDVILLRSADEPDPYVRAFAKVGLRAACHPVLAFGFPHQDQLREYLEDGNQYGALVATSPRVGRALKDVFEKDPSMKTTWGNRAAYAVGPKTAQSLRSVGLEPRGAETGSADALAERIVEDAPGKPLLFLSGNRRRDTLPNHLRAADVAFDELVVYETRIRSGLTLPPAMWLVFFSPSGGEAIQQSAKINPRSYRIAAIGPTTASSLRKQGRTVEAVAETPSPDGLVTALASAEEE